LDLGVVAVRRGEWMVGGHSADRRGGGEREAFCDGVHGLCFVRVGCDRVGLSRQFIGARFIGADDVTEEGARTAASPPLAALGTVRRMMSTAIVLWRGSPNPQAANVSFWIAGRQKALRRAPKQPPRARPWN